MVAYILQDLKAGSGLWVGQQSAEFELCFLESAATEGGLA
jgi:hypothetical protein